MKYKEQFDSAANIKASNEEMRDYVERVVEENGCPKLILERVYKSNYIVSLENLALVFKGLVLNIDKKKNLIEELRKEEMRKERQIASLEEKIVSYQRMLKSEAGILNDLKRKYDELNSCKSAHDAIPKKVACAATVRETISGKKCLHEIQLEEVQKLLNANNSDEIIKRVKENVKSFAELHEFAREVSLLANKSVAQSKNLKDLVGIIKGWISEREECGKILLLRNKLCKILYNHNDAHDEQIVHPFLTNRLKTYKN
eukprot:TRINITY_DN5449_c0_g2_i1.p1 TRINITY_DN5449_c0_g2~~TRINITY_DN5449_c0_g2_i1.p1  ORF type:complete len:258 (+),score=72.82 TRINITY_DN5449_c0_g2_i1:239-1012(+)